MRLPRLTVPGIPQNIVVRGNNRELIFREDHDYLTCLNYIKQTMAKNGCALHAYALMPDHVHLLLTPLNTHSVSKALQLLARLYVQYFNQRYTRTGTLWAGRYKSALVDPEVYALNCYRYIETNPLRARLVEQLAEYPWSSYHANAMGKSDVLIKPLKAYRNLGDSRIARCRQYADLCDQRMGLEVISKIRNETNRSRVVGDQHFKARIERLLDVDLSIKSRGGDRRSQEYRQSLQYAV